MDNAVFNYEFDNKLMALLYCPTCKSKLHPVHLLDIFAQGLACEHGHRFFVPLRISLITATTSSQSIQGPTAKVDQHEIIKAWLTEFTFRSRLNDQLATMIRRIDEITATQLHIPNDTTTGSQNVFRYCPLCLEPLKLFPQDNSWVEGLNCANGHEYFARNGVDFSFEGKPVQLHDEMSDDTLSNLIKGWLEDKSNLESQLHEQIKAILVDYSGNRTGYRRDR